MMSNDLSHLLVKLLWIGFAALARPHDRVGPWSSRPKAASESVKVAFLAASRKAAGRGVMARFESLPLASTFIPLRRVLQLMAP